MATIPRPSVIHVAEPKPPIPLPDRVTIGLAAFTEHGAGLEPVGVEPKGTTRSTISRRFVTGTTRKLNELMARDLSELDLLAIFIDGIDTAEHTIVAALGVDADGHKHPLGLWEGSTENKGNRD